jgi:hypothetical protein
MKRTTFSAEIDMINAQSDGMDGIIRMDEEPRSAVDTLAGPSGKVTRTGDTPWVLVDGIKWGEERVIFAPDGGPACQIRLRAPKGIDADIFTNNRVVARFLPDGSIREIMIDFTPPYLDVQDPAGIVLETATCTRCDATDAVLKTVEDLL